MLGAKYYETDAERSSLLAEGGVPIGIGENTTIRDCIIDKNARIGKNVVIANSECQICNKGFPTGQAMGGLKRCHWTGDKQASSVTFVEIPADEQKIARGLSDFDLNMPSMVEEEDLDSAISKIDAVPASCQSLRLKFKDHASFYCSSVI